MYVSVRFSHIAQCYTCHNETSQYLNLFIFGLIILIRIKKKSSLIKNLGGLDEIVQNSFKYFLFRQAHKIL
ncbi:hypothetical protein FXB85_06435 [Aggregatibacter actinomycetemcomitans]|nr:hypothetical protein FXB85_06435 [Aggregatibacter actinomycetemcomitans]